MEIKFVCDDITDAFCWRVIDTNGYGYDFATYEEAEVAFYRLQRAQRAYVVVADDAR